MPINFSSNSCNPYTNPNFLRLMVLECEASGEGFQKKDGIKGDELIKLTNAMKRLDSNPGPST